jgi:CheY-like chemotaxis protein
VDKRRVLLADDDPPVRGLLRALMKRAGYEVLEASTGQEALDLIRRGEVDVVLLDLMMRGVSGFDVIEQLRGERPAMLQSVIVVTAASGKDLVRLRDEDVFRVLRKPFEIQALLSAVAECFAARPDH